MYKPGYINHTNALTQREQDLENQATAKISLHTQTLLQLEQLDPWIQAKLLIDLLYTIIYHIDPPKLDLINELLQANHTTPSL